MKGKGLIGIKVGMTRVFDEDGSTIPVTVIQTGNCKILQKKEEEKDGYKALQVGFDPIELKKVSKPAKGLLEKIGSETGFKKIVEFRFNDIEEYNVGDDISLDILDEVKRVNVIGTTKGRGFAGVIKRWNFQRGRKTHGGDSYRTPGSIGQCAYPGKVFKGKRMPGNHGNSTMTQKNLKVVKLIKEDNLLLVKGGIPGANGEFVYVTFK